MFDEVKSYSFNDLQRRASAGRIVSHFAVFLFVLQFVESNKQHRGHVFCLNGQLFQFQSKNLKIGIKIINTGEIDGCLELRKKINITNPILGWSK